jgi:hypothetical protein
MRAPGCLMLLGLIRAGILVSDSISAIPFEHGGGGNTVPVLYYLVWTLYFIGGHYQY